ncbi:hypothetical protein JB92DRAFT_2953122 [Gautieria morchelliformis]|nr:hypothetical protein JB92DRAFT_2953122 [Gautieria morchelliformis]
MVAVSTQNTPSPKEKKTKKTRRSHKKKKPTTIPKEGDVNNDAMDDLLPTDTTSRIPIQPEAQTKPLDDGEDEDMVMIDPSASDATTSLPAFPPLPASAHASTMQSETRRILIPPHRLTPLKKDWINIFSPLTEMCGLQVRMNVVRKCVEMRTSSLTKEVGALQRGADFVKAYALGFEVNDALALLRMDDLYLESFEIKDVKTLHGDHLARAIGRIAGHEGKTKFTIENTSRTRIVLADTKIHILGSFQNIKIARDAIVSLIMGSPPGKVYAGLRIVGARMKQRAM